MSDYSKKGIVTRVEALESGGGGGPEVRTGIITMPEGVYAAGIPVLFGVAMSSAAYGVSVMLDLEASTFAATAPADFMLMDIPKILAADAGGFSMHLSNSFTVGAGDTLVFRYLAILA